MELAVEHHRAGRLTEAEALLRAALARDPNHVEALRLMSRLATDVGQPAVAAQLLGRAVTIDPNKAAAWSDLGNTLHTFGQFAGAVDAHRKSLQLDPNCATAWNDLGNALHADGQIQEAIASYREAMRRDPDFVAAKINLYNALEVGGHLQEAAEAYEATIRLTPKDATAHFRLGNILAALGESAKAIDAYRETVRLHPQHSEGYNRLGIALLTQGKIDEAIACFRNAVRLDSNYAQAFANLGHALQCAGQTAAAIVACREAIRLDPNEAGAYANLGIALLYAAQIDEAVGCFRKAVSLQPTAADTHSNLIYALNFHPGYDPAAMLAEARNWNAVHARTDDTRRRAHENDFTPDRKLRIGYVSPDFRQHVVGDNLLPLLREHDHESFEIYCYSNSPKSDFVTTEIRSLADGWQDISGLNDQEADEIIRLDRIDILVDLTMHMAGNRLPLFARKPAPVQICLLASCSTSGMDAIDYRISDPYLDPPGCDESCYVERVARLPRTAWNYQTGGDLPEISPSPAASAGFVTFGCRNNFAKVSAPVLDLWARALEAIPHSRLLLQAPEGAIRKAVGERFSENGIAAERIEFLGREPWDAFIGSYHRIDIALDPFPYNGWITTCDALRMGVPVVTLAGRTLLGRGGKSILSNVGLPELIAETPEQYIEIAVALANDLPRLQHLRATLRERFERSPLRDAKGYACDLEAVYRQMWRTRVNHKR